MSLKIALISSPMLTCPPTAYGGLEQIVFDLACSLTEMGHKVVLFAPKGSKVPPKGFLMECGEPRLKVQTDWLSAEREMWKLYETHLHDFDIIHSHDWFGFCYATKAQHPSLNVTHTHHGGLNMEFWGKAKPSFNLNLIGISKWMTDVYASQGFEAKYCYNGIELEKYPYKPEKGDRLLFVGRISSFKQPHVAIEVAQRLKMGLDIVGGTFVDDPNYLSQIRNMCDGKDWVFHPDASHEEKIRLMQDAKALIFPSCMGEPFGLVAVEAMSTGTPVVALNDGAIGEVVKEGGVVCDVYQKTLTQKGISYNTKKDPVDALVEAVRGLNVQPVEARKNAERFSREHMASQYERLYREILSGSEW